MGVLKRYIGVLILLAFLSGKYTMIFSQTKESVNTHWSKSAEDPSEESKEKEEENKEVKSPIDELFYDETLLSAIEFPSSEVNTRYLIIDTSPYLPALYLPPKA